MTIDINELRRLTQEATAGPWKAGQYLGSLRQFVIHTDCGDKGRGSDVAFTSAAFGNDETVANARFIAAANPAAISELLDRLEEAEKERDAAELMSLALRTKVEEMEKQEPAGYGVRYVEPTNGEEDWDSIWMHRVFAEDHIKDFTQAYVDIGEPVGAITVVPLYALPGAQGEEK